MGQPAGRKKSHGGKGKRGSAKMVLQVKGKKEERSGERKKEQERGWGPTGRRVTVAIVVMSHLRGSG